MPDKFIPFNPETAKNGDIVYGLCSRDAYLYVGLDPLNKRGYVLWDVKAKHYCWVQGCHLESKAPKKTVWVNLVKYGLCGIESSVFACEKIAKGMASKYAGDYLGTFPIEIDDVA